MHQILWALLIIALLNVTTGKPRGKEKGPKHKSKGETGEYPVDCLIEREHLGCFADSNFLGIVGLDRGISGGDRAVANPDSFNSPSNRIEECQAFAAERNWSVFAVQFDTECYTAADAEETYDKHGESDNCNANGRGGVWANDVYRIPRSSGLETGVACELDKYLELGTPLTISCGEDLIAIKQATFNVRSFIEQFIPSCSELFEYTAPGYFECIPENSLQVIQERCNGKSSCGPILANSYLVDGETCPDLGHLNVTWECIKPEHFDPECMVPEETEAPHGEGVKCDTSRGLCPDHPGEPGEVGVKGEQGADGTTGDPGPSGGVGDDGVDGDPGERGAPGEKGPIGATGEHGDTGADGADAAPCEPEQCLQGGRLEGNCVQVARSSGHAQGYWRCPIDHVITGFERKGETDMLVTCCHV